MFLSKTVIRKPDILNLMLNSGVGEPHEVAMSIIDDTFESIQELSHHLYIQEMDFELYSTAKAATEEPKLRAAGCLAFEDCSQKAAMVPMTVTLPAK